MRLSLSMICVLIAAFTPAAALAEDDPVDAFLDDLRQATQFQTDDGSMSLDFDFYVTVDNWVVSQPPPGIMQTAENYLVSPRLSMMGTFRLNDWLSVFALGNVDRGFDPTDGSAQIRPDEYFVRLDPFDGVAKFTFGKEATCFGQWVNRHFSWQNPLVNAPLTYEWITTINTTNGRVARKNVLANRHTWTPVIWGPSYTSGGQLNGTIGCIDYALEIKNNALGSNPDQWDLWNHGFYGDALTYSGRLGWRPTMEWTIGASASSGSYVVPGAFANWDDLRQTVVGADLSWSHGQLEVWSEVNWSQWDVRAGPVSAAGTVALVSYFVESKWKFAPAWWLAGRWNQQLPGDKPFSNDQWDDDVWRIDGCLGWHINRSVTAKAQYSYTQESGTIHQGEHVFDLQLVFEF